jgi:hypothetical protein
MHCFRPSKRCCICTGHRNKLQRTWLNCIRRRLPNASPMKPFTTLSTPNPREGAAPRAGGLFAHGSRQALAALTRRGPPRPDRRSLEHSRAPSRDCGSPVSRALGGRPHQRRGQPQCGGHAGRAQHPVADIGEAAPSPPGHGSARAAGLYGQAQPDSPAHAQDADL